MKHQSYVYEAQGSVGSHIITGNPTIFDFLAPNNTVHFVGAQFFVDWCQEDNSAIYRKLVGGAGYLQSNTPALVGGSSLHLRNSNTPINMGLFTIAPNGIFTPMDWVLTQDNWLSFNYSLVYDACTAGDFLTNRVSLTLYYEDIEPVKTDFFSERRKRR